MGVEITLFRSTNAQRLRAGASRGNLRSPTLNKRRLSGIPSSPVNGRDGRIVLKNSALGRPAQVDMAAVAGMSFANFRRFWAVAARTSQSEAFKGAGCASDVRTASRSFSAAVLRCGTYRSWRCRGPLVQGRLVSPRATKAKYTKLHIGYEAADHYGPLASDDDLVREAVYGRLETKLFRGPLRGGSGCLHTNAEMRKAHDEHR